MNEIKKGDIVSCGSGVVCKVNWVDYESGMAGITYTAPEGFAGGSNVVSIGTLEKKDLDLSGVPTDVLKKAIEDLRNSRKAKPTVSKVGDTTRTKKMKSSNKLTPETVELLKRAGVSEEMLNS